MRSIATLLLGLTLVPPALAQQPARPIVVELFTSQGCSSCPPADALLSELAGRPDILPLAFHVTYWDRLGWRDPFALELATSRQRGYQRLLDTETIYTPQMIVEGRIDVVGSDRAGVRAALTAARAPASVTASVPINLMVNGGQIDIRVGAGVGPASVLLIGYDPAHRTAVARGENAGRQLSESNIVRSLLAVTTWRGQALSVSSPAPTAERTAVILQAPDGRILGAAVLANASGVSG
jgi:hypothetical protein